MIALYGFNTHTHKNFTKVYHFYGRFILTDRDKISSKKPRKTHYIKVVN